MGILTQTHNGLNFLGTEAYIQADGSTKMTIKSSGNIGIGTTSPSKTLHVLDANDAPIRVESSDSHTGIQFKDPGGDNSLYYVGSGDYFYTTASVGIGITSPGAKLHVYSSTDNTLGIFESGDNLATIRLSDNDTSGYWHTQNSGTQIGINSSYSAENLTIRSGGNVGIGTTTPDSKLHINDGSLQFDKTNTSGGGDFDFIKMGYNGSWSANQGGIAGISVDDATGVVGRYGITYGAGGGRFVVTDLYDGSYEQSGDVFYVRGDGDAYIQGNLGIGTTSPKTQLHLNDGGTYNNTDANNRLFIERDDHTYILMSTPDGKDQGIHFHNTTDNALVGRIAYQHRSTGDSLRFRVGSASSNNEFLILNSDGAIQIKGYGAGILKTDSSGSVSVDTSTYLAAGSNLSDLGDVAEARTNLGLGTAATSATGDFAAASHNHDSRYYTETESDQRFPRGRTISYSSAEDSGGVDAWYKIFQITDSGSTPVECHIRGYAHTSLSFIVSEGYLGGHAHINILDALSSSTNSGYKFIEGVRIASNGDVEILLNGGSNVSIEMTLVGDAAPVSTLAVSTTAAEDIKDSVTVLSNGMMRTYGKLYIGDTDTNTSSTTALVLNGEKVDSRTLGSNAFNSTTIPTNNNQLTNGAGYVTGVAWDELGGDQSAIQVSGFNNDAGYLTAHPNITAASSSDNSGRTYIQDITLDSNGHVTGITTATETVVNTNTTYSAGTGLDLSGTTFSVEADLRDGITHVGKDSNNYIQFDSTNGRIDFYAGGVFVARMESDGDLHVKGDVIAFSDIFG